MTRSGLTRRAVLEGAAVAFVPRLANAASPPSAFADAVFLPVLEGFLRNAAKTSSSFAVCDFPDGTLMPGSVALSGKTYDSASRMMPALAAWVASGRQPAKIQGFAIEDVLVEMFRNAFDPAHPDYWRASPAERQHQLQVESSIVAWSVYVAADRVLPRLSAAERTNIQNWLASCTRVPVRNNNWAWFTAVNQAVRIVLGRKWKEFSGDAEWMLEDLKVLDRMAVAGDDGWYTDSLREEVYDYYNFWVFASHFLYWNRVIGKEYPEWSAKFGGRLRKFLQRAPYFFGANGSHVLFGRSLIYRWAVLTPLVLAYQQKLWPYSPGLLRGVVRRNLEYLWGIGAFDSERGKLRESLSEAGTREIRESYIDNGHPYWGMQAFALYLIPPADPFWTAHEEPLPVEKGSYRVPFAGPKMLLAGDRDTGEVRWMHSVNGHNEPDYRDKYTKFSYSSHFPWCIVQDKSKCIWDGVLVFRDPATGEMAGRGRMITGRLLVDGVERVWTARLGGATIRVKSTIRGEGAFEYRRHEVEAPPGTLLIEGSYALAASGRGPSQSVSDRGVYLSSEGSAVAMYAVSGYDRAFVERSAGTNIVHSTVAIASLGATARPGATILECVHYASTKAKPAAVVEKLARK